MKLKKYIKNLQKLIEEKPEVADYEVVYSVDSEGNAFYEVDFPPSVGYYDGEDWQSEENLIEDNEGYGYELNAVCVN